MYNTNKIKSLQGETVGNGMSGLKLKSGLADCTAKISGDPIFKQTLGNAFHVK